MFDAGMDHLDEVTGAVGAAVKVAFLGSASNLLALGGTRRCIDARCQGVEDGVEALHDVGFAANHLAVAAFEPPDAATDPTIKGVDAVGFECVSTPDIIVEAGAAAIDDY